MSESTLRWENCQGEYSLYSTVRESFRMSTLLTITGPAGLSAFESIESNYRMYLDPLHCLQLLVLECS